MDHHATQVLKQCQNRKKITKSNCSKQKCFVDVAKPAMVPVVFDEDKRKRRLHRLRNPVVANLKENSFESLAMKAVIMMRVSCLRRIIVSDILPNVY